MRIPAVDVAVAVVRDAAGRVLLAERTRTQIAAGWWELPGGKIDPGETAAQAAARELHEEVGLHAGRLLPWIVYRHDFATKSVRLHFFRAEDVRGQAHGREGQRVAWVDPSAPTVGPLLPSNARALDLLALPALVGVLEAPPGGALWSALDSALDRGIRLLQLRLDQVAPGQRVALAARVVRQAASKGARVLLSGSVQEARAASAAGLHTRAAALAQFASRPAVGLWSVSCHDEQSLQRAALRGADIAFVSPVLGSKSHPGLNPLGWDGLRRLAAVVPLSVYAQGGLDAKAVAAARAAGAAGVAVTLHGPAAAGSH